VVVRSGEYLVTLLTVGTAEEQAAQRRVATLVARGVESEVVFTAVAQEVAALCDADIVAVVRHEPGGELTVMSGHGLAHFEPGARAATDLTQAMQAEEARSWVSVPILVEGHTWGVIGAGSRRGRLPPGTRERLVSFTELAATAIAGAQARLELRGFAAEQAALRRVATLVARAAPPEEVLAAVTEEAGRLLDAAVTALARYDPDGRETTVGVWSATGAQPLAVGTRTGLGGRNVSTLVFQTGRPARIDDYDAASGAFADTARDWEFRASVGVPIWVEDRLWGVMSAGSRSDPLPAGTEARLAGFTELASAALANAEAQAALTASRARIVAATDQTRRRVERDLHDGAQQRLVSLALRLRAAQATVPPGAEELAERLEEAVGEANGVQAELREISHGLHPAVLTESGLRPALRALARRAAVPVRLDIQVAGRLPEQVEVSGYYVVAEALTNAARHARASAVSVTAEIAGHALRVAVRDDGVGGADFTRGTGLAGLKDRVEALGGRIVLDSPSGAGTSVQVELPLAGSG
jgi:signal transduction histidine kinase